jgi:hypothetical protein
MYYAYNVTLRHVHANIVAMERQKYRIFSVCICILSHPSCIAHALYCHLWPNRLYHIFPRYLINGTIFGGKNYSNFRYHENPSSEGRVFPCRQRDMTKLIVAFRNSANAPKKNSVARSKLISADLQRTFSCYLSFHC